MNKQGFVLSGLLMTATACDGSDAANGPWTGSYSGLMSSGGSCTDGSSTQTPPTMVTMDLVQRGSTVTWVAGCGVTLVGEVSGDVTTFREATCPPFFDAGNMIVQTFTNGTLRLTGSVLTVEFVVRGEVSGAAMGTCDSTLTGRLRRL